MKDDHKMGQPRVGENRMIVTIQTTLGASPDAVWAAVKTSAAFLHVTRGFLGFSDTDCFPRQWQEGDSVYTRMWLFHIIPTPWIHHLWAERVDDTAHEIQSREHGGFITTWDHLIRVEETSSRRTLYTDQIVIKAGVFTPLVVLFAHVFYRYRQARWRRLACTL
jgi:hypothetical protein